MSKQQNDQKDLLNKLGKTLLNADTRKKIEDFLYGYSKWDKTSIIGYQGTIILGLKFFLNELEAIRLWKVVTSYPEWMDDILQQCDTSEIKDVILSFHTKFFPIFGGCDTLNVDDWARMSWFKTIDANTGYPSFKWHIFKRNGEQFFIETSTGGILALVNYIMQEVALTISEKTPALDDSMKKAIENIRESLDQITKEN